MGCTTISIVLLCLCGTGLSIYAAYIGAMKKMDHTYQAYCDIDEYMACSDVITALDNTGLGFFEQFFGVFNFPNSYIGMMCFPLVLVLGFSSSRYITLFAVFLCFLSCMASVYLIYVMLYVMEKICVPCLPVHIINPLLFIIFTLKLRAMLVEETETKKRQ